MALEQLMGRYFRLRQELAMAYNAQPWHGARIDRLANDLAATEREIAAAAPVDEQCDESMLGGTAWADRLAAPTTYAQL